MFKERFIELLQNTTGYRVSKATGIPDSRISQWKNHDELPSVENLMKLADYFGVSTDYLLGRTDKPEVNK